MSDVAQAALAVAGAIVLGWSLHALSWKMFVRTLSLWSDDPEPYDASAVVFDSVTGDNIESVVMFRDPAVYGEDQIEDDSFGFDDDVPIEDRIAALKGEQPDDELPPPVLPDSTGDPTVGSRPGTGKRSLFLGDDGTLYDEHGTPISPV